MPTQGRWFKVQESILWNDKLDEAGNLASMAFIRILAVLNQRRSVDGVLDLKLEDIRSLAGMERADEARRILSRLVDTGMITMEPTEIRSNRPVKPESTPQLMVKRGAGTRLMVCNYLFYQVSEKTDKIRETKNTNIDKTKKKEEKPDNFEWTEEEAEKFLNSNPGKLHEEFTRS